MQAEATSQADVDEGSPDTNSQSSGNKATANGRVAKTVDNNIKSADICRATSIERETWRDTKWEHEWPVPTAKDR